MREKMSKEQGTILLPIARAAISQALNVPHTADETSPWLAEHGACFVTLTQDGELRGCIGSLQAHRPLLADVKSNAVSAAMRDPRFTPLTIEEIDITTIEVSLLSTSQEMIVRDEPDALAQLRPGVDGIIFEYGHYRSTFLPQVWESLAQPRQFLGMLRRKAGLPEDFWAEGIKLSRYTVTKWSESEKLLAEHPSDKPIAGLTKERQHG
jgi:AmmeMemoRadiSam system protein A